ncbi:MAG: AMP-binding protein [Actinomycetota bacterium]
MSSENWPLRTVPEDLVARYVDEGWWTDETLGDMVADALASMGDVEFNVHSSMRPWRGTIGDVHDRARALAATLADRGVRPGDVVVFQLPNWMEAAVVFWASTYLGAAVVPIVHFYGEKEVGYILRTVQPEVFVSAASFGQLEFLSTHARLVAELDTAPVWLVVGDGALPPGAEPFDRALGDTRLEAPLPADPDAPAVVGFTSGTTRDPKGVIHSHRTMGFETRQLASCLPAESGPAQITAAPVGHFIGMLNAFLISLMTARPVNLLDVWDPAVVLRLMKEEKLAMGGGATYFLISLLDHPDFTNDHLDYMPYVGLGGSTVPVAVMERAENLGIRGWRAYGSTEHPSITSGHIDGPIDKRHATDGSPLPGVDLRLDDDGQIISRGPDLFLGYIDPTLTDTVFDDDGWYHTGDVGVVDDDGYLTITDRLSDIIIRGGENISAVEVEDALLTMPSVAEVAVVSIPDETFGERAAAVMRLHPDTDLPSLADVQEHLAAVGLAKQKWPEHLHEVADFPRTASGKVQKYVVRQSLRGD